MTDEQLVQRFLDQELSAEERVRFVVRLGRDEPLRTRVIALEQLALDTGRLPRPIVPERFVASVMERIEPAPAMWRRLAEAFVAPRSLQWNLASAAAVACVAALIIGGVWRVVTTRQTSSGQQHASASATEAPATPMTGATGASSARTLVRLVVLQPGARTVQVAGDFNGWNPSRTPLERASSGAWTVTLPLKPGRYEYQFVVDGRQWIADPFAAEQNDDGFGSRNAVIEVRRPGQATEAIGATGAVL